MDWIRHYTFSFTLYYLPLGMSIDILHSPKETGIAEEKVHSSSFVSVGDCTYFKIVSKII